jgi:thymidylate synthase (FAD)
MIVQLLHNTPLYIASKAIRKCYASEDKSDTILYNEMPPSEQMCGTKDKELIYRVGNKYAHKSTLRHVTYVFECDGVSTKTLLALTRHCIGKDISVQSTRWTIKKRLKDEESFYTEKQRKLANKYITFTGDDEVDEQLIHQLEMARQFAVAGKSNDIISMTLPQAYNYSFILTMNIESLQWFLKLRTADDVHYNIKELAYALYDQIPSSHKYLFTDYIKTKDN